MKKTEKDYLIDALDYIKDAGFGDEYREWHKGMINALDNAIKRHDIDTVRKEVL